MSDLSYTIEVRGVQDLDKLASTVDKLTGVLNAGTGSGKSLEELRKILVGMKGQGSVLQELSAAVKNLNTSADGLKNGITKELQSLTRVMKSEFKELRAQIAVEAAMINTDMAKGITSSTPVVTGALERQGRTVAAKARAEATRIYEAMVGKDAMAKIKPAGMQSLFELKEAGAQISSYHKGVLARWVAGQKELDTGLKGVMQLEADRYQSTLQKMAADQAASDAAYVAARKASLERGKTVIVAAAKQELAVAARTQADTLKAIQDQVRYASSAPSGDYSSLRTQRTFTLGSVAPEKPVQQEALGFWQRYKTALKDINSGNPLRALGDDMGYVHSASRGLASGFNMMWLTWGQLAPLFIGAGISNAFTKTAKTGMDVAHALSILETLGGATGQQVQSLAVQLDHLAKNGPVGPVEVAEAMKTLSLAGLKANEILAVTRDVLNFSIAGTTSLDTAATTLMAVSTAFGMGAEGFSRAGDVISKAAADSMTSVESFSEAMKTASVINAQYGVSLEDTATGLAALSQLGIQGTAAGTALRNMYADLSGRSIKVAKLLREQGIEMRDATGAFRPMLEVVDDLNKKLGDLTGISQKNLLQALLSERGAKGIIELLRLIRTEARDTGAGLANALEGARKSIADSAGFMAISAAKLSLTAQNQFKSLGATISNTLNNAYKDMEPQLLIIMDSLREAFASEEALNGLRALTGAISNLFVVLVENGRLLLTIAAAYGGLKTAQMVLTTTSGALASASALYTAAKLRETVAVEANTAALARNALAGRGAAAATGVAGMAGGMAALGAVLPGVNVVLGVLTAGWLAYEFILKKSHDAESESVSLYYDKLNKRLSDEADQLERINDLRAQGLTLAQAQARIAGQDQQRESDSVLERARSRYSQALTAERNWGAALSLRGPSSATSVGGRSQFDIKRELDKARLEVKDAGDALQKAIHGAADAEQNARNLVAQQRRGDDIMRAEMERRRKEQENFGTGVFQQGDDRNFSHLERVSTSKSNVLKQAEEQYRQELELAKKFGESERKLLKAELDAKLILQGEYGMREVELVRANEASQLETISRNRAILRNAYVEQRSELEGQLAEFVKANPKATAQQLAKFTEDNKTSLDNLSRDFDNTLKALDGAENLVKNNAFERLKLSIISARGEVQQTKKAFADFLRDEAAFQRQRDASRQREGTLLMATPAQRAQLEAAYAEFDRYQSKITDTTKTLEDLEAAYASAVNYKGEHGIYSDEEIAALDLANARIRELRQQLEQIRALQKDGALSESAKALDRFREQDFSKTASDLSNAIQTALFEGGKKGREKLRDLIVSKLREPITLVVDVMANVLLGGMQSLLSSGAGALGAGGNVLSQGSSLLNLTKNGTAALGGFANGLTAWGPGGSVSGVLSNPSLYSASEMLGAAAPWLGGGLAAYGLGKKYGAVGGTLGGMGVGALSAGGASMLAGGSFGAGAGAMLSNPYGWAAMAVLALLGGDDSGTFHAGGSAQYSSTLGKLSTGTDAGLFGLGFGKVDANDSTLSTLGNFAQSLSTGLASTAKAFGKTAGYEVATAFADDTSKDGAWGALRISRNGEELVNWANAQTSRWAPKEFADGEAGFKEFTSAVASDVLNVLKEIGLPTWATDMLSALGDTPTIDDLSSTVDYINQAQEAIVNLGEAMPQLAAISGDAASKLIEAMGGIEGLAAATDSYYRNFYSEAERFSYQQQQLRDSFSAINIAVPSSIANFRHLVESQDLTTEAGRKTYASLMRVQDAFYSVAAAVEEAFNSISQSTAESVRDIQMSIMSDEQKYNFLNDNIETIITKLRDATDPATITALFEAGKADVMAGYNLLSDTEQVRLNSEFIDRLYRLEAEAQARLSISGENMETAVDRQERAVDTQMEASRLAREAADTMIAAATEMRLAARDYYNASLRVTGSSGSATSYEVSL